MQPSLEQTIQPWSINISNLSLVPWAAGMTLVVPRLTLIFQIAGVFMQGIVPQNCLGPHLYTMLSAEELWSEFSGFQDGEGGCADA